MKRWLVLAAYMIIFLPNMAISMNIRLEQEIYFEQLKFVFDFLDDIKNKRIESAFDKMDLVAIEERIRSNYKNVLTEDDVWKEYLVLSLKNPSVFGLRRYEKFEDSFIISIKYDVNCVTEVVFQKHAEDQVFDISFQLEKRKDGWIIIGGSYFEYLSLLKK
jgi:hypothetical protein